MNSFIFLLLLWSLIECLKKKVPVYQEFIKGVKEGLHLIVLIFPTLMLLTLWVNMFQNCGLIDILGIVFQELCQLLHVPIDILLICVMRPISSQGALVILKSIYDTFGVDHIYSILGSIIQTGSDTTLYVVSLYFEAIKKKRVMSVLLLGLLLDLIACLLAFLFYKMFIL